MDDSDSPSPDLFSKLPNVTYLFLEQVLPLGSKLNIGIERASGEFILKMDDDDYYAPCFLQRMFNAAKELDPGTSISFLQPFLFLNLLDLRVLRADPDRCSGATFFFHRKYWESAPFRNLPHQVDSYFLLDHKTSFNCINEIESFLQVRHTNHLWNFMPDGESMDSYLAHREVYDKPLSDIVPQWVFDCYLQLRTAVYGSAISQFSIVS